MPDEHSRIRRVVLKRGALGLAAALAASLGIRGRAQQAQQGQGQGQQKLQLSDPLAQALKYTEDASKASSDLRKPNAFCHNCRFFQGKQQTGYGPCQVFQGKLVNAQGWCSSWTMKDTTGASGPASGSGSAE